MKNEVISVLIMTAFAVLFFVSPLFPLLGISAQQGAIVAYISFGIMAGNWMTFLLLAGE